MKKIIGQFRLCDLITMSGSLFAIIGIMLSISYHFHLAVVLMLACAVCDSIDGYFARKRENTEFESTYGAELDSLSDFLAFGVFPAVFVYRISYYSVAKFIVPIFVLCGLIRLAYFNTLHITKKEEKGYFRGVPITMSAFVLPVLYLITFFNYKLYSVVTIITLFILGILYIVNIRIKKPDISKMIEYFKTTKYSTLKRSIINFVIFPLFVVLVSDLFFKINTFNGFAPIDALKSIVNYPIPFLLVWFIFSLITLIFTALLKNTSRAKFTVLVLTIIFLVINDVKFIIMNNPVMLSDVNFLNSSNLGIATTYLNTVFGFWIVKVFVKAVILLFIAVLIKRSKLTIIELDVRFRFILLFVPILIILLIFKQSIKYSSYMIEKVYRYNINDITKIDSYSDEYYKQGLYQGILFNKYTSSIFKPSSYNRNKVKKLLSNVELETENWGQPNIVILLSESFSDITNISEIEFNEDILENIHRFDTQKDALVADTLVSVYGGQSVNSEWEVQTAASNYFYIPSYIVYNEYYNKKNIDNVKKSPHIIHSLKDYYKEYVTPWGGDSYNSKNVYTSLGIDKTHYNLNGTHKGRNLADYEITNSIIKELKKNESQPKLLIYATEENHMPCNKEKYSKYDISVKSSSLNQESVELLTCYAQGVYDADQALGDLYEEIQKIDRDTIVIFFGDHLPYITNSKGDNMYVNQKYFNTGNEDLDLLRKHTTKSVVFSNYGLEFDKSIKYVNLNYIGAYVYSHLDVKDKEYYNFVNNMRKQMPVFTRTFIYDPDTNKITQLKDASKEQKKIYDNLRNVQYYEFFDKD